MSAFCEVHAGPGAAFAAYIFVKEGAVDVGCTDLSVLWQETFSETDLASHVLEKFELIFLFFGRKKHWDFRRNHLRSIQTF